MKRYKVTVEAEITVEFDENSEEFKQLWDNYHEFIDSDADYEELANSIASMVARYGVDSAIEGIGYLKYEGENQRAWVHGKYEEQPGYINVLVDTDINKQVDFDVTYTREIEPTNNDKEE